MFAKRQRSFIRTSITSNAEVKRIVSTGRPFPPSTSALLPQGKNFMIVTAYNTIASPGNKGLCTVQRLNKHILSHYPEASNASLDLKKERMSRSQE